MFIRPWPALLLLTAACDLGREEVPLAPSLDEGYVIDGDLPANAELDDVLAQMGPGSFAIVGDPVTGEIATVRLGADPLFRVANADFTLVSNTCTNCGTGCPPTSRTIRTIVTHTTGMAGEQFYVEPIYTRNYVNASTSPAAFVLPLGNDATLDTTGNVVDCSRSFAYVFELTARPRAFVTSTTYNGNLGGVAGADAKCQARADAAGLGGTWKAWIASPTDGLPATRFSYADPWVKVNSTLKVADDLGDLTDGTIDGLLNVTEFGTAVSPFNKIVWTGISAPNTLAAETCNGWTRSSSSFQGRRGSTARSTSQWVDAGISNCNMAVGLYCFEQ
ncbi:MAG: DUF1554 domain-containing protein [Alphaproteobacteria bacterium]|nr:DUF1554 domain-containing protein [Alphaproteobacteria bacterium]MCB9698123.1 DUF1554 domain-containing protein [Alphaproteobacteria bacterium]